MEWIFQPFTNQTLGQILNLALNGELGSFTSFDAAIAFVKRSGVQYIAEALRNFGERGGTVRIIAGVDHRGTSTEGLSDLLSLLVGQGQVFVYHDERLYTTFHPKLYLFRSAESALAIIGSGNLTQGGLFTNVEAASVLQMSAQGEECRALLALLDHLVDQTSQTARPLTPELIEQLVAGDYIRAEALTGYEPESQDTRRSHDEGEERQEEKRTGQLFGKSAIQQRPPQLAPRTQRPRASGAAIPDVAAFNEGQCSGFVMTLQRTDAGVGQLTPGTSRRSPEIFIPLRARDDAPAFWGWPDEFEQSETQPGKWDRRGVQMRLNDEVLSVNWMVWTKADLRLRHAKLRDAGRIGDLIRIERVVGEAEYEYQVFIVPSDSTEYDKYAALCAQALGGNSRKRYGYYDC